MHNFNDIQSIEGDILIERFLSIILKAQTGSKLIKQPAGHPGIQHYIQPSDQY